MGGDGMRALPEAVVFPAGQAAVASPGGHLCVGESAAGFLRMCRTNPDTRLATDTGQRYPTISRSWLPVDWQIAFYAAGGWRGGERPQDRSECGARRHPAGGMPGRPESAWEGE